jgi:hypothetical protein
MTRSLELLLQNATWRSDRNLDKRNVCTQRPTAGSLMLQMDKNANTDIGMILSVQKEWDLGAD